MNCLDVASSSVAGMALSKALVPSAANRPVRGQYQKASFQLPGMRRQRRRRHRARSISRWSELQGKPFESLGDQSCATATLLTSPRRRRRHQNLAIDDDNRQRAGDIWRSAVDPRGTLVHVYLEYRKLDLPDEIAVAVIRFHPTAHSETESIPGHDLPGSGHLHQRAASNPPHGPEPAGAAIRRNGKNLPDESRPIKCGTIKIDPDEDVTMGLCIGEGVETCLAGRQKGLRPVWCAISTAGIASFPILPGIECLHILRENDTNLASPKKVEDCASRWRAAGCEVIIADPASGRDLNDELRGVAA